MSVRHMFPLICGYLAVVLSGAAAAQESDLNTLIQSVQPTYYTFLPSPLEILADENASVALALTDLQLEDGGVLPAGALVGPGLAIKAGILWNLSNAPMSVFSARGDVDTVLPDELVVVARQQPEAMLRGSVADYPVVLDEQGNIVPVVKRGSMRCNQGYYACCYELRGRVVCRCICDGVPEPAGGCTAGGPGAVSSSIALR